MPLQPLKGFTVNSETLGVRFVLYYAPGCMQPLSPVYIPPLGVVLVVHFGGDGLYEHQSLLNSVG